MSEIVDRVALALFNHDISRYTNLRRVEWTEQELMPEHGTADIYRGRARVAIEAMREPTDIMLKAGASKLDDDLCTETNALNVWQAMSDEALK